MLTTTTTKLLVVAIACSSAATSSAWMTAPTTTTRTTIPGRSGSCSTGPTTRGSLSTNSFASAQNRNHRRGPASRSSSSSSSSRNPAVRSTNTRLYNKLLEFLSPYESKIPEELREEIYKAEANTPAARDRGTRVALYATLAIVGILLAAFNGFLTDLRDQETARAIADTANLAANADSPNSLYVLNENGFGWVVSNPFYRFLFTNKIGGILSLLLGGGSGLMAEAEFDSKRLNAEKIYEELERRRAQKTKSKAKKPNKRASSGGVGAGGKKKRRSGKEQKRLAAISEVVLDDKDAAPAPAPVPSEQPPAEAVASDTDGASADQQNTETSESNNKGVFGKMKDLYEKADSMAASQALIMNKNLEEAGLVEKITDETGLRVIGREEAKKLQDENQNQPATDNKKDNNDKQ